VVHRILLLVVLVMIIAIDRGSAGDLADETCEADVTIEFSLQEAWRLGDCLTSAKVGHCQARS